MKYYTRIGGAEREYQFERKGDVVVARCGGETHEVQVSRVSSVTAFSMLVDGRSHDVILEWVDGRMMVQAHGQRVAVEVLDERERTAEVVQGARPAGPQQLCAAMPGVVVAVRVEVGDTVVAEQSVLVLEAMKMQNPIATEYAGIVTRLHVEVGQVVQGGQLLIEIEEPEAPS